ncbi:DUF4336 domain-containing protein [Roseospira marina]|uniref:DUF4336 domain-containing protein n=1 Tax=Roseospira marina TaxID=140057 RepID=A0A5M6ID22_9PROT|nr:DUF4336 domain-containing protein [Roseospira marina]KAA5605635.1 DUF4336 domain-containing protein [Roseospira marina]MBB4313291.1 hypothetical protein [Roseospira marina]MBB5085968.1 hypothetical protein [Roseospira marina]
MTLQPIDRDIWLVEGPVVSFYGLPYTTRAVIVRLPDGGLWVWSPVDLTQDLRLAVGALGTVTHLVSPNRLHHLWLADWARVWPDATLWGPASTQRKRADLTFAPALEDTAPTAWAGVIDQVWLRASVLMDEVVFFHRPSGTAILGDYSENFPESTLHAHWPAWARPIARLLRITEPYGYAPAELRWTTFRRSRARASVRRMLAWNPERVVMAHGTWQSCDGRRYLESAFAWVLGSGGDARGD